MIDWTRGMIDWILIDLLLFEFRDMFYEGGSTKGWLSLLVDRI